MTLLLVVVFVALVFEYINGFHDTANSIAMGVSTKVLTPRAAILLAASTNLIGALVGTAVAKTISSGLVQAEYVGRYTVLCALLGAIVWNLATWWIGLPSSSSHALIGGLCGAAFATSHGNLASIIWFKPGGVHWWEGSGIVFKVVIPMVLSPIMGFVGGGIAMTAIYLSFSKARPITVNRLFSKLQMFSGAYMGFSHGSNDAQKTMGVIALALVAGTQSGALDHAPAFLSFLHLPDLGPKGDHIPVWIKVTCATVMASGTAAGGWRIIKTMGQKMVKVQPVNGFTADATAATVLLAAAHFGMPVSTTHAVTTSIMGVGFAKRASALNLSVVSRIIWAWILTLPVTAAISYGITKLVMACGS